MTFSRELSATSIRVRAPLLYTSQRYESYRLLTEIPLGFAAPHDRLNLELAAGYDSRPSDNFFGIGNDTAEDQRTAIRTINRELTAGLLARVTTDWTARLYWGYRNIGATHPRRTPSAQLVPWDSDIPGLFTGAILQSGWLAVERNTKDNPDAASRGSMQHFEVSLHEGTRKGDFSYWKYRVNLQQYFPLDDGGGKVIAIQGNAESNQQKGGSTVPFFDLATLGSFESIRGFHSQRFHDKSAVSVTAEYRYRIWPAFDWAFFADAGQVGPELGDFDIGDFHAGYGMRFIVRPNPVRAFSFDIGKSHEGVTFYLNIDPSF
jgi:outer membrane protein assembly factor BamA